MSVRQLHPYDEDFAPTVAPWLEPVPIAETRARTKPIHPILLTEMAQRCKEE